MEAPNPSTALQEWKSGWRLVIAAAAGMSLSPLMLYTMGLFIHPLEQEFGWSRAAIMSGLTVHAVVAIALSWLVGLLIDRVGPRRVALTGGVVFLLAFAALAANAGTLVQWWVHWLLLSISAMTLKATVWISAIASRFDRARGMAFAFTISGASIAAVAGPIFGSWMIYEYGWRMAYLGIAGLWAIVVLPLLAIYFYGAADLDRRRSGPAKRLAKPKISGAVIKESMLSSNYIKLALACPIGYFAISGSVVNLVPMLSTGSMGRAEVASLVGALGIASFAGRVVAGYWLDHYSAKMFGAVVFSLPVIAFLLLFYGEMNWMNALIIVVIFGLATGAEFEVASFLTSRYFGLQNFGLLFGTIAGLLSLAAGTAPAFFGHIYDQFGSYDRAILIALPLSLLASLLIASLNRDPKPRGEPVLSTP